MSLFTTQDQLKTVVPIVKAGSVADWDATITAAEKFYLKKILGNDIYNDLHNAVQNNNVSGDLAVLLPYARAVSGNLGVYEWLPLIYSQTSAAGERTTSTQDAERSPKWSFDLKRKQLLEHGGRAIEELYLFLESNENTYTDWAGTTYRQYFINKTEQFNKHVNIGNSRWTFLALLQEMEMVEEMYIKPVLGDAFFADLKTKIANKSITGLDATFVNNLQKPIALFTLAEALPSLGLMITANGAQVRYERNESEYNEPATDPTVIEKRVKDLKSKGTALLHNLKIYLNNTASNSVFAAYFTSPAYTAPVDPATASRLPNFENDTKKSIFSF